MKQLVPSFGKIRQLFFDRSVISWLAMIISITSFYLASFKPAEIHMQPGQSFQFWYNTQSELQVDYPLAFANTGAQTGTILSLALIIQSNWMKKAMLCKWGGTKVYDDGWKFVSRERPISLVPKTTDDEMVNFTCGKPGTLFVPEPGDYKFTFLAWTRGGHYSSRVSVDVTIDEKIFNRLQRRLRDGQSLSTWVDGNAMSGLPRMLGKKALETLLQDKS